MPLICQFTPDEEFCTAAVNCATVPVVTLRVGGETTTLTTGGGSAVIVTLPDAEVVRSACSTAVTVTSGGVGTLAGAL